MAKISFVLLLPLWIAAALILAGEKAQIPPRGVEIPAADRAELEAGVKQLGDAIGKLRGKYKDDHKLLDLLPDIEIYHSAVHSALAYNEFMNVKEVPGAKALLKQGKERAAQMDKGETPWTSATGHVVRGYISKIDGSVQPVGLLVPADYKPGGKPRRLDIWLHGRSDTLTEVNYIRTCEKNSGEFAPAGAFVLQPYGRFCNAFKFAGEVDVFEGIDRAKELYPIDSNRIVMRGFSMGGAGCWHMAAHHAGVWAAANPGAGFAETAQYAGLAGKNLPWYEQKLWHMYDATDYAVNLFNCPTVAYSGEIDKQKQAADVMAEAMKAEGLELTHIIGPKTEHKYEPGAKKDVEKRVDDFATAGRDDWPKKIRFTTWTLRYNQMKWVTIDAMEKGWERARVDAEFVGAALNVTTKNVSEFTLRFTDKNPTLDITVDGQSLRDAVLLHAGGGGFRGRFQKTNGKWSGSNITADGKLHKRHGLQGPIDDAFMDSFIMVRPTGKGLNEKTAAWISAEMTKAISDWRRFFRGEARVMDDSAITEKEITESNLVLWGDPSSNAILKKMADKLPIKWDAEGIHARGKDYALDKIVPQLIYPNPLNPKRYVVLNSGVTFMKNAAGTNARHVSLLPDWAIIDISAPEDSRVQDADFFGSNWEMTDVRDAPPVRK